VSAGLTSLRGVTAARLTDGRLVDLAFADGVVRSVRASSAAGSVHGTPVGGCAVDAAARVVIPGLVDAHVHLDKAYLLGLGEKSRDGRATGFGVDAAIAAMAEVRQFVDRETVLNGARRAIRTLVRNGVVAVRAHAEVTPESGLAFVEMHQQLREEHVGVLDIQTTAFPQHGLTRSVLSELANAARTGAVQVVAGCPYVDEDPHAHLDSVFELAARFQLPLDLHLDFDDDPCGSLIGAVVDRTEAHGMQGQVTIGHVTKLAAMDEPARRRSFEALAAADVALVVMPATDLYLGGVGDPGSVGSRSLAPIDEAASAGVRVAVTNNNIANDFAPYGNGNLLQAAWLAGLIGRLHGPAARALLLDAITVAPARILGLPGHGLEPGLLAHLAILDTTDPDRAVFDAPAVRSTVFAGSLVEYPEMPVDRTTLEVLA
jgi:cytosine deaminase